MGHCNTLLKHVDSNVVLKLDDALVTFACFPCFGAYHCSSWHQCLINQVLVPVAYGSLDSRCLWHLTLGDCEVEGLTM
jgi:hypothetical protein